MTILRIFLRFFYIITIWLFVQAFYNVLLKMAEDAEHVGVPEDLEKKIYGKLFKITAFLITVLAIPRHMITAFVIRVLSRAVSEMFSNPAHDVRAPRDPLTLAPLGVNSESYVVHFTTASATLYLALPSKHADCVFIPFRLCIHLIRHVLHAIGLGLRALKWFIYGIYAIGHFLVRASSQRALPAFVALGLRALGLGALRLNISANRGNLNFDVNLSQYGLGTFTVLGFLWMLGFIPLDIHVILNVVVNIAPYVLCTFKVNWICTLIFPEFSISGSQITLEMNCTA